MISSDESSRAPSPVQVGVKSFVDFFGESTLPISVDTYQRGFVWNSEKVVKLADDLVTHEKCEEAPPYYMGTLLVHNSPEKEKRFIIDGQQRLTALTILHHEISGALPENFAMTYSPRSARHIRKAAETYQSVRKPSADIFNRICFTIIEVDRVDLAFTFFDTQNNRGVPLHATDLLKAYHLRAVEGEGEARENLQTVCAKGWESVQQSRAALVDESHVKDAAPRLFGLFLWRARCWKGNQLKYGGHDALMEAFQKESCAVSGSGDGIPLYRSRQNRLGTHLRLAKSGKREIQTHPITLSEQATDLPFAIRQPVHKGIGFFLYAEKYGALLQWLMDDKTGSTELSRFREVYALLMGANSIYLREIFVLGALMYVDQFGEEQLWEFGLWYEHALGAIRLQKQQVRYEAAKNFFGGDLNLLDVIAGAYLPDQVIDHLKGHHRNDKVYAMEQIDTGAGGVQGRYKQAVLKYYGKDTDSLKGKAQWLEQLLIGRQEGGNHVV